MNCDFTGIQEKLKRAHQNILNLDGEIKRFFECGEYRVVSTNEDEEFLSKAFKYHASRPIPKRFSVLAGEIIHHLRSCLDHIIWQFSGEWYRRAHKSQIEFPILEVRPVQKKRGTGYERKVKGISDPGALILIELLQPYNTPDPISSLLLIIHKLDIIDKHRELVLCVSTGAVRVSMDLLNRFVSYKRGIPGSVPVDIAAEFKRDPKIFPQISFQKFGGGNAEPVVQGLMDLHNFTVKVCDWFEKLSKFDAG